jgi:hypothetical protein
MHDTLPQNKHMARRDTNIDIDTRHLGFDVTTYERVIQSISEQLNYSPSPFYTTWDESTPEKPKTDPRKLLIK